MAGVTLTAILYYIDKYITKAACTPINIYLVYCRYNVTLACTFACIHFTDMNIIFRPIITVLLYISIMHHN